MSRAAQPLARALIAGLALGACSLADDTPRTREAEEDAPLVLNVDLERMIYQARYDLWEASAYFPDGKVMRHPPEGTVPHDRVTGDRARTEGLTEIGDFVDRVPIPLTREVLERGQDRYGIYCAPCHGVAGDGVSHVARVMSVRKPPSLVEAPITEYAPGRVYQAIEVGYGLMRSYAADLPLDDRWAVVAYVQALQRAHGVALDALPQPVRARALLELQ